MGTNRIKSSNRSIPMMSAYKQLARARDVNNVVVRNLKKRDLPIINQLVFQLISAIDKKEGIDRKVVSRNSRSLSRSANSHFLVAEIGKTIAGFAHFTTRRTITHRGPSGLIDSLLSRTASAERESADNCCQQLFRGAKSSHAAKLKSAQSGQTRGQEGSIRAADLKSVAYSSKKI